jgi:hypothetical protein
MANHRGEEMKLYRKANHTILAIDEASPNAQEELIKLRYMIFTMFPPYVRELDKLIDDALFEISERKRKPTQ